MLYICIYKLFCEQRVSTVHVEQHQSTEIVIIGEIAVSSLSLLKIVLPQTLERQGMGNTARAVASQLLAEGLQSSWESSRAGNTGLTLAVLLPAVTRKKK